MIEEPEIAEVVVDGRTGYLVPEHDVEGLGDRIARLAENPEQHRAFARAAREHVRRSGRTTWMTPWGSWRHSMTRFARTLGLAHRGSPDVAERHVQARAGHEAALRRQERGLLYASCLLFTVWTVYLYVSGSPLLKTLCEEDGLVENLTALFYVIAGLIFLLAATQSGLKASVWYWGFGLLFLFIAGEEISWGQRLLGFSTPSALIEKNVQREVTLHNLQGFQGSSRGIGVLLFSAVCFLIPLTNRFSHALRRWYGTLRMPIYPLWAVGVTALGILFMAIPRLMFPEPVAELDEIGELYLPVGFLVFAYTEYIRAR